MTTLFKKQFMRLMGANDEVIAGLTPGQRELATRIIDYMNPASPRSAGAAFDNKAAMPNERIAEIRTPTLIIHAKDDALQLFHNAKFAAATIPGSRLVSYDKGGHLLIVIEAGDHSRSCTEAHPGALQRSGPKATILMIQTKLLPLFLILILTAPPRAYAQDSISAADSPQIKRATVLKAAAYMSAYYAVSLFILSKTWYKDKEVVPFHFYNDSRAYLQVDKLGHAFGSYVYSYTGYRYLLGTGLNLKEALLFGATLGLVLQTPIEIMDGVHEGYGFSWGDVAANALGSAIVLGQELIFKEQIVKQKFSYWESSYTRNANGLLGRTALDRLFTDYNGHTYWMSLPVNSVWRDDRIPVWLNAAVGYGANGMYGEFENLSVHNGAPLPEAVRYRQYLFSLDIDWSRIRTDRRLLRVILKGMTFIKLPFPTIECNSKGQWKGYWLYF
jgi:hypothetical protein